MCKLRRRRRVNRKRLHRWKSLRSGFHALFFLLQGRTACSSIRRTAPSAPKATPVRRGLHPSSRQAAGGGCHASARKASTGAPSAPTPPTTGPALPATRGPTLGSGPLCAPPAGRALHRRGTSTSTRGSTCAWSRLCAGRAGGILCTSGATRDTRCSCI
ncbi:unnamed protein product, partial [Ixodes pacificus]